MKRKKALFEKSLGPIHSTGGNNTHLKKIEGGGKGATCNNPGPRPGENREVRKKKKKT